MSVRESRLCDFGACNQPADGVCELCKRDACKGHIGNRYIVVAVMTATAGVNTPPECLGKCKAASTCVECHATLNQVSTGINNAGESLPLAALVVPMRDKMIEAAAAWLAEKKLAKKSG